MILLRSAAAAALLLALPAGAEAASVRAEPSKLFVYAPPGERNEMAITREGGGRFRVSDAGAIVEPGDGCRRDGADDHAVLCETADHGISGGGDLYVVLGDGDDRLSAPLELDARVDGGPGNDEVIGQPGEQRFNVLHGGPGDDVLVGGANNDSLYGDDGHDRLVGGEGNDFLCGGAYESVPDGSRPHCNGFAPTGDDALEGGAGEDLMFAGDGNNRLSGGEGKDYLTSLGGADVIDATGDSPEAPSEFPVTDTRRADMISPGEGDDVILAADGVVDFMGCGGGHDRVVRDPFDDAGMWDCEEVTPPFPLPPVVELPPVVTLLPGGARVAVRVACAPLLARGCTGAISLLPQPAATARAATARAAAVAPLARRDYAVRAGEQRVVRLRLTTRGRRHLRRHPRARLVVSGVNTAAPPSADPLVQRTARVTRRR